MQVGLLRSMLAGPIRSIDVPVQIDPDTLLDSSYQSQDRDHHHAFFLLPSDQLDNDDRRRNY